MTRSVVNFGDVVSVAIGNAFAIYVWPATPPAGEPQLRSLVYVIAGAFAVWLIGKMPWRDRT